MHKKLELFRKSTHTTMLNPNLSSENCGKKIQSDRPKKWSKITILSPITFWENSRSWSWSDLRSLFEQVILMWSKIAKKVIGHYFVYDVLLKSVFANMDVSSTPLFFTQQCTNIILFNKLYNCNLKLTYIKTGLLKCFSSLFMVYWPRLNSSRISYQKMK